MERLSNSPHEMSLLTRAMTDNRFSDKYHYIMIERKLSSPEFTINGLDSTQSDNFDIHFERSPSGGYCLQGSGLFDGKKGTVTAINLLARDGYRVYYFNQRPNGDILFLLEKPATNANI